MGKELTAIGLMLILAFLPQAGCAGGAAQPTGGAWRSDPARDRGAGDEVPLIQRPEDDRLTRVIRPLDRVLFVGDDLTQQWFYTQATGAALLATLPRYQLRIFNGGRRGSTAAEALEWIDGLMDLAEPTVVFLHFGLRDGKAFEEAELAKRAFEEGLERLIERVKARRGVRQVVVLSPVPVATPLVEEAPPVGFNRVLSLLSESSRQVAERQQVGWINLFDHTRRAWIASNASGGAPLTMGGEMPTEQGHTIIASIILKGIGVTGEDIERIGWSPLPPMQMARIRPVLAIEARPPDVRQAWRSRDLYRQIYRHDEAFFRSWRLESRISAEPDPRRAILASDEAWAPVSALALAYYGAGHPEPEFEAPDTVPDQGGVEGL
ncbi:MAG: hypothetical protein JJU36_17355 [Phycisphaeraceae bacterium]|nr:hypothetical protein [Phycisphaeraceae bacterium]